MSNFLASPFVVTDVPSLVRCHFDTEPRRLRLKSQKKNFEVWTRSPVSLRAPPRTWECDAGPMRAWRPPASEARSAEPHEVTLFDDFDDARAH